LNKYGFLRPLSVPASPRLRYLPALRKTPEHGKRPGRDDFLERRIVRRRPLCLHYGGRRQGQQMAEADARPDEAVEKARAGKPESQGSYSVIEMRIWSILLAR
jgi:hypothetical protein